MLSRLNDFVHSILERGLIFATCKCHCVFFLKNLFLVLGDVYIRVKGDLSTDYCTIIA